MEHWLRFANLQLPPRLANALVERFGCPEAVFEASLAELLETPDMTRRQAARVADPSYLPTSAQMDYVERAGVRILARTHAGYPTNLSDLPDAPPALFVRGALDERDRFAVALVGSRQASPYGRSVAARLARDLCSAGLTVVSGGAIGIDAAAHRGAVEAGGRTLVVLGCGLDIEYPRENLRLFEEVVARGQGALLTEFPLGATPEPWRFPMRNRIISGLSSAVVVVEAGAQSGALTTASIAAEQGRDVLAVPGNVDRPGSRGTNGLIRDGAALVEDARDILRALGYLVLEPPPATAQRPPAADLPAPRRRLLEGLSLTPKHIDVLAAETGMAPTEVSVEMTMLELGGLVRRLPGNSYIRVL